MKYTSDFGLFFGLAFACSSWAVT